MKPKYRITATVILVLLALYGCSSSTGDKNKSSGLPAPTDVRIESIENGTVSLKWSSVRSDNLKGYYVYWNAGAPVDTLSSYRRFVSSAEAEITGLKSNTTYYFAVTAVDTYENESPLSIQISGKGESNYDNSPPPVPKGLTITSIGNGAVSLRWTPVEADDLKGYNMYWRGGAPADSLSANRMFVSGNSIIITNLDYDTLYYFAVTAVDLSGNESAFSVQQSGKPLNTTSPSPPTGVNIAAENVDVPKINVYWAQNTEPDISHYNVYRALSAAGLDDSLSAFITSTFQEYYTDINVEVGITYFYKITAVDKEEWESSSSSIMSDRILPPVELISPVNYQYTGVQPTFSWKPVEGAEKYVITLMSSRIGGEIWYTEVNKNATELLYSGSIPLISGNTYYWRAGAVSKMEINSESKVGTFVVKTEN